jgi:hypothetical protein
MTESPNAVCGWDRVDRVCPQQWLYLFGDGGVVYSEARNRFAGLDAAGVLAYRALEAGATLEDLGEFRAADGSASTSDDGLKAIYELSQGIFPAEDEPAEWPALDPSTFDSSTFTPSGCGDPVVANIEANIEIDGIPISLQYPPEPLASLCRDYFRNCPITEWQPRCCLSAQQTENGWAIYVNGREFMLLDGEQQLGLGLLHAARSLLYAQGNYDVAFHAAMVAHGDCGILLSAPRECGKSTLAAYLVTQGFDLLTDEPTLLNLDTRSVKPLPLPVSLKQGSWSILEQYLPRLTTALVHTRSDGTKIRLTHPSEERRSPEARRMTQILFPHYRPACEARVESISPFHSLRLLTDGGMLFAKHIGREGFENFLRLVCLTPAYRIQYGSLRDAERMLREAGCL